MEILKPSFLHEWTKEPQGKNVIVSSKLYKDAKNLYEGIDDTLDENTVMYDVYSIPASQTAGKLNWGLTVMHPVYVNGECNVTRGHFHQNLECEEYYWCSSGKGLLMLMDEDGKCWCEEMAQGSLHHIQSNWAHRLINTSNEDLKVVACWPGDAGHDYKRIEEFPFPYRMFKQDDKIIVKERS